MKIKWMGLLAAALLLLWPAALAEDITLQDGMILQGMNQSWRQGYEPTVENGRVNIYLPLKSKAANGRLTARLVLDDPEVSPFTEDELKATCWVNEGLYALHLRFPMVSARHSGDYAATVVVTGKDADGDALEARYPVVIRVRDGKKDALRPGLSAVTARLKVGEEGEVEAVLTNTSRYAEMRGIELTLTDASGEVMPGGSNRLAVGSLMPGQSVSITYPVKVKPDAAVALHALTFALSYTALDEPDMWSETFTLPVTQDMRLEQGGASLPGSVVRGDVAAITLPLMNMGRGALRNVTATLSIPGLVERQSVLVGAIAPGETQQARLTVAVGKDLLGEMSGEIRVAAEDDWGNETGFSVPVSFTVVEPPDYAEPATPREAVLAVVPMHEWILMGVCLLLIAALIVQGALLRGKLHRMEEDRL